jgi:hypothetical protein
MGDERLEKEVVSLLVVLGALIERRKADSPDIWLARSVSKAHIRSRQRGDQLATTFIYKHRKRGVFGWLVLLAFWLFNVVCLLLIVARWFSIDGAFSPLQLGAHIGAVIIPVYLWVVGDLILGMFAYLTRGRRVIIMSERSSQTGSR